MKQIVRYSAILYGPTIGDRATVVPVNHPDVESVTNGMPCYTTPVVSITGQEFETRNTIYKPLPPVIEGLEEADKKVAA